MTGESQDNQSEVSRYFTTWGSPIHGTDAASGSNSVEGSRGEGSGKDSEEEEDLAHIKRLGLGQGNFGTPFLRPPPSFLRSHTEKVEAVSASVLANRARRGLPSRGLTEDWIRQHTEADVSEIERLAWLSDKEEEDEQGYSSLSSEEEELEEYKLEFGQKTPTLKSFLERKDRLGTHSRLQSIETVRPRDLQVKKGGKGKGKSSRAGSRKVSAALSMTSNGTYETAQQSLAESKEEDSEGREISPATSSYDKPLPVPPLNEETDTEAQAPNKRWSAAALPNIPSFTVTADEQEQPELPKLPMEEEQPELPERPKKDEPELPELPLPELPKTRTPSPTPRVKKKVPWGRKNISVLLPLDEDRGQPGQVPRPLTQREAQQMFESWEQLGYNIDGFDVNLHEVDDSADAAASQGQSRDMWPHVPDIMAERAQRQFRVSIPDKRQWDAYVQDLQEAKLRALGVSLGDEDESAPLQPPALSRVASGQYPPLTASAMSNKSGMFSPPISGAPTGPSSFAGSSASVAQKMLGKLHTSHQSMSFNSSEHPFGSPFSQQQSPVAWSPQHMLYQGMRDRSASVSYSGFSPVSSMNTMQQDGYFPKTNDATAIQRIQRERQGSLINQLPLNNQFNQPLSRQSPRLQELKTHDITPGSHFMPQHKQNLSDSLQKEIEDAEYHLEEQFERQLEHDDYSPHSEMGFDMGATPMIPPGFERLHHPQPHSRGHSLSQRQFGPENPALQGFDSQHLAHRSEVNSAMGSVNHSGANTPSHIITQSMAQNPWTDEPGMIEPNPRPSHKSKPSISKLNVAAAPFVFNPAKATEFKPLTKLNPAATFTPGKPAFEFPSSNPIAAMPVSPELQRAKAAVNVTTPKQSISSPVSILGSGKINALAPEFTPGGSTFSFSRKVRPDAPEFKPMFSDSGSGGDERSLGTSTFGKINTTNLANKKSMAIPIVKPVSRDGDENIEDKDGGVGQPEGSFKRNKGDTASSNEVPMFVEPNPVQPPQNLEEPMPLGDLAGRQSPVKRSPAQNKPVDKENADPSGDENGAPAPPSPAKSIGKTRKRFEDVPDYEGNSWAPVDWADEISSKSKKSTPFKIHDEQETGNASKKMATSISSVTEDAHNKHKKNSLSALAKPFQFGQTWSETEKIEAPVSAVKAKTPSIPSTSPTSAKKGIAASKWASATPSPDAISEAEPETPATEEVETEQDVEITSAAHESEIEQNQAMAELSHEDTFVSELEEGEIRESNSPSASERGVGEPSGEPTFEDIDDIMRYMNEDPNAGVVRHTLPTLEGPGWDDEAPDLSLRMPRTGQNSPIRLEPSHMLRSNAPSPSPGRRYQSSSLGDSDGRRDFSRTHDEAFLNGSSLAMQWSPSRIHRLNDPALSDEPSAWDDVLEEDDEAKFEARSLFFDSHVNDIVGGILADKLDPIERALETVQQHLAAIGLSQASSRKARHSTSAQESDADDEDDEEDERPMRREMSPVKKARAVQESTIEQMRAMIQDALAAQRSRPQTREGEHNEEVMYALNEVREQLEEMKVQTQKSIQRTADTFDSAGVMATMEVLATKVEKMLDPDFQGERLRNVVEDVAERRIAHASGDKISGLEKQLAEMQNKLKASEANTEREIMARRQAEDADAKAQRLLRLSRVEEQRVREELEEKEKKIQVLEQTVGSRYSAEDEVRLREAIQHKDEKIMELEEARQKSVTHAKVMEASAQNAQRVLGELEDRRVELDRELSDARQETREWKFETQKAHEITQAKRTEASEAVAEATALRRTVESLRLQMQESLRIRETFRGKLAQLQERMAAASHEVNQENAQRTKKESQLIARQEVLDARLEAEARTRERLMSEIERLEATERSGIRAVHDNAKLTSQINTLETKLNEAEKRALRYKRELEVEQEANLQDLERTKTFMQVEIEMAKADLVEAQEEAEKYKMEFEEARESGLSEVGRTKMYMQAEIEAANNQVNLVRQELEDQVVRLRVEVDNVKMESDTAKERHEMLLEDAVVNAKKELASVIRQHEDKLEDIESQHERSLSNAIEDAQRAEQHLLERLSLSSAKTEHLQDRVSHLEEKLELAKEAALAAAQSAKNSRSGSVPYPNETSMPEKISPQALRESIMVLQEQLQNREEAIELLEQQLEDVDPDAQNTIVKQNSEISWLRELLQVRIGDLQDIIDTTSSPTFNALSAEAVRGAAIRLKANLQMEQMERERAQNGNSGMKLPNIASSLRDVATPRVAQVGGALSSAWGNWRKSATNGLSEQPSRTASPSIVGGAQSFLSGFMTPPISGSVKGKQPARPSMEASRSSERRDERREKPRERGDSRLRAKFEARRMDREAARERPSPRKEMLGRTAKGRMGSMSSISSITGGSERERYAPSDRYSMDERSVRSGSTARGDGARYGQGRDHTLAQGESGRVNMPQTPPMMHTESYDRDAREEDYSDAGFYDDDESTVDEAMFGASLGR